MQPWVRSTSVLLIILLLVIIVFALLYRPTEPVSIPDAPKVYIQMEMSLSGIVPDEINVTLGDFVFLNITSLDVQHIFGMLPWFGGEPIPAKSFRNISFAANILGNHRYQCMDPPHTNTEFGSLRIDPRPSPNSSEISQALAIAPVHQLGVRGFESAPQKRPQ